MSEATAPRLLEVTHGLFLLLPRKLVAMSGVSAAHLFSAARSQQHVVVELENAANVRFLHARAEAKSLRAITSLGGAGAGGAADEAHYLWPKYAGGMTYNASFVDSLFGQAFYRPSR